MCVYVRVQVVDLLLSAGANVNISETTKGMFPLHMAVCVNPTTALVQVLVAYRSDRIVQTVSYLYELTRDISRLSLSYCLTLLNSKHTSEFDSQSITVSLSTVSPS